MTDHFPEFESDPPTPTFRADLPRRRHRPGAVARGAIVVGVTLVLSLALGAAWVKLAYLSDLPPTSAADALWSLNRAPGVTFLDRSGARIATRGPRNGTRVRLAELPAYVPRAFLAAEDRRFYQHGPVDLFGALRALVADARAGQVVQGGSTLTQQLAKSLFLKPDQTLKRKVQEAALAFRLGGMLSKDQILELYLNRVFFGASAAAMSLTGDRREGALGRAASRAASDRLRPLAGLPK